jgi:hypothetical protein
VNWSRLGANLPNVPVIDLIVDADNRRLVAATQGRGAWTIPVLQAGDFSGDGDVDLEDFAAFVLCFGESLLGEPSAACLETFDSTGDESIDLADFADLAAWLTGPG